MSDILTEKQIEFLDLAESKASRRAPRARATSRQVAGARWVP
jgi:hypothetical protein